MREPYDTFRVQRDERRIDFFTLAVWLAGLSPWILVVWWLR